MKHLRTAIIVSALLFFAVKTVPHILKFMEHKVQASGFRNLG